VKTITIVNKWQKEEVTAMKIHKQCPLAFSERLAGGTRNEEV